MAAGAVLVPVTIEMHNFWAVTDPQMRQMRMVNFMKNVSMLGGALLLTQFGAGPWSLERGVRARRGGDPRGASDYDAGAATLIARQLSGAS